MNRQLRGTWTVVLVLCLVGCPASAEEGEIVAVEIGETSNLTAHEGSIYFGGQPAAEDFGLFAERGVKTVINLRTAEEVERLGFDEQATVESAGMRYVHVPIGREEPSEDTLSQLMELLEEDESRPVLLHCGSSNRVGYVWGLYQGARQGKSVDEAVEEGKAAGLRSSTLEEWLRQYLAGREP
jgi:uncharacterized protein (TIGR01244 family)